MVLNEMPTITVFTFENMSKLEQAISLLNPKGSEGNWVTACQNKYNQDEIFIQHSYYEDLENGLKRALFRGEVSRKPYLCYWQFG